MNSLRVAWGGFLSLFLWDWFVTLTFNAVMSTSSADRAVRKFLSDIEKAAGQPIFWFRAEEYGARTGRFHVHLLIGNVAHLRRLWWMDEWNRRHGWARIIAIDRRRGAPYYCAKYVTKQGGEWQMSDNLQAFRQYQAVLPLSGPTKSKPADSNIRPRPVQQLPPRKPPRSAQPPLPLRLKGVGTSRDAEIAAVYREEVTHGTRRAFREFFEPSPDRAA